MEWNNKNKRTLVLIVAAVAIVLGIIFCIIGFDKKNHYHNSEYSFSTNANAYVGGDAYNYIINGTYFSGYLALSGALFICGCVCGVGGLLLDVKSNSSVDNSNMTSEQKNANISEPSNNDSLESANELTQQPIKEKSENEIVQDI